MRRVMSFLPALDCYREEERDRGSIRVRTEAVRESVRMHRTKSADAAAAAAAANGSRKVMTWRQERRRRRKRRMDVPRWYFDDSMMSDLLNMLGKN